MFMGKILCFTGKKSSGKNTFCNFMTGLQLKSNNIIDNFDLHDGKLYIEDGEAKGILALEKLADTFESGEYAARNIWPYAKIYAFADPLKDIAIELFNCPRDLTYGSDEDKNTIMPHLLWENIPGVTHDPGPMTIRQFLQVFGTEVMRKIWGPVWVNSLIRRVENEESDLSLISDLRFDNEAGGLRESGHDVKIIKLTRKISDDNHSSENYIDDKYVDAVIDNQNLTILESCQQLVNHLQEWKWLA